MKFTAALLALVTTSTSAQTQTIADIVSGSAAHTTLLAAVTAADPSILTALSATSSDLTLFAPDDGAFNALIDAVGQDYVTALLSDPWTEHLSCVLLSHVLQGSVESSAITGAMEVESLFGTVLSLDNAGGTVTVNDSPVTGADIMATNGIVHSISTLPILPPCVTTDIATQAEAPQFSTLLSLVAAAGLVDALKGAGPLTLYAPTDDAFSKVPEYLLTYLGGNVTALTEVLTYHVVSGLFPGQSAELTTLNGDSLTVTAAATDTASTVNDIPITGESLASNGKVYIIDSVLLPSTLVLPEAPEDPDDSGSAGITMLTSSLVVGSLSLLLVSL